MQITNSFCNFYVKYVTTRLVWFGTRVNMMKFGKTDSDFIGYMVIVFTIVLLSRSGNMITTFRYISNNQNYTRPNNIFLYIWCFVMHITTLLLIQSKYLMSAVHTIKIW